MIGGSMAEKFTIAARTQREWAWLLALYLFLGSLGGCLYLLYRIFHLPPLFALLSLVLVLLGAGALLFKLGSPQRAWRAIFRPTTSWISRGVLIVSGFLAFGALSIAPVAAHWIPIFSALPWSESSKLGQSLNLIASLFALLTTIYPGFVLSNSRAIPFWNTPILPLLFFTYAVIAAVGVILIGSPNDFEPFVPLMAWMILINMALIFIYIYVMSRAGGSAREAVRHLNKLPLGAIFWIGVIAGGLILPLVALIWIEFAQLSGVCLLLGGLLLRYCVLKAGVYMPAVTAPVGIDLTELHRTSADLKREYSAWEVVYAAARQKG